MMQPYKSVQKLNPTSTLGYPINQTQAQEHNALNSAFELVRKAKHLGLQTRLWVDGALRHTEQLLHWGTDDEAWNHWKNKVTSVPQAYLDEMTSIAKQFTPLNPPLKTEHIRPFLEAISLDRQLTVEAVEHVVSLVIKESPKSTMTPPSLSI